MLKNKFKEGTTTILDMFGFDVHVVKKKKKKRKRKNVTSSQTPKQLDIFDNLIELSNYTDSDNTTQTINYNSSSSNECSQIDMFSMFGNTNVKESAKPSKPSKPSLVDKVISTTKKAAKKVIKAVRNIAGYYKITAKDKLGEGSLKQKCEDNINAIKIIKELETENRLATKDEQKKLVKYVGWGGMPKVFENNSIPEWEKQAKELKILLTEEEWKKARESTLTAFYTPIHVIKSIYELLDRLGFEGGKVLEPSMGIGHFFGCMPTKVQDNSRLIGIELDKVTGQIAKNLYQDAQIKISGYQKVKLKDDSFDLIISNIPFGDFGVHDEEFKDLKAKIHDYYFIKSLKKLRNGGLLVFITSAGTMDKKDSSIRKLINEQADLVGAIRLPDNAFRKNANTEVVTDIIVLQKGSSSKGKSWENVGVYNDNEEIKLNEYYIEHPEMLLGNIEIVSSQFGPKPTLRANGVDLEKALKTAIKNFPKDVFIPQENDYYMFNDEDLIDCDKYPHIKESAFDIIPDTDKLYQKQAAKLVPVSLSKAKEQRVRGLIKVKKTLTTLLQKQLQNCSDEELKAWQIELNNIYDEYVSKFGYIAEKKNKQAFREDPEYPLLCALELKDKDGNYQKSAIFTERTIQPQKKVESVETVEEGLMVSMNETGHIKFNRIAELTGKSKEEVIGELREKRLIFLNPESNSYESASEYLSGNVREKLELAKKFVSEDKSLMENIKALESVQPIELDATEIDVKIGASWMPTRYIKDFVVEVLNITDAEDVHVNYEKVSSSYTIETRGVYIDSSKNFVEWGTDRVSAVRLIQSSLNLQDVAVYDYFEEDGKRKRVLNKEETQLAREKQDNTKLKFKDWIFEETERRETLVKIYNETFNCIKNREFNGDFLTFPGMNPKIKLRSHQKAAVSRILFSNGCTLLAHCVGSGKSFTMQTAGMELLRLGLSKKIMYCVPNNLVESGQFANEFLKLYPNANLLVATSKDFQKSKRRKFVSKIVTGNWDAIIIGHSTFGLIPVSRETQEKFINNEIAELEQAILECEDEDSRMVKQLESKKKKLEEKLEKMLNTPKDNTITWEELGVDYLMIDEAHNFKNLFLHTKLCNIAGIPGTSANKTSDMYMKIRYLQQIQNGRGVVFATGTCISNSMTELFTMQRYLQPETLYRHRLVAFDSWASTFGDIITSIEISPTGQSYRAKQRFARFYNVPELMGLFKECADIVTPKMVKLPIPELEGGKPTIIEVEPTEEVQDFVDDLVERAEAIYDGKVDSSDDNMLCVTNDGRRCAVDPRLVGIMVDNPNSKINRVVENVYKEWLNGEEQRLTQLIFSDIGTPTGTGFDIYSDIREKLVTMGVPKEEIKFIHEGNTAEKRNELIENVRTGKVRILIGSTAKMGEGMNSQDRLIALHEIDAPWRPSDVQQREGRILRQGNMNEKVRIYRYVTKGTFDAYSWQTIETKAKFISQIMNSDTSARSMEDFDQSVMSYAEVKAAASDNPLVMRKFEVDSQIQKLYMLQNGYKKQKFSIQSRISSYEHNIDLFKKFIAKAEKDIETRNMNTSEDFSIDILNVKYTERKNAGEQLVEVTKSLLNDEKMYVGKYRGFQLIAEKHRTFEEGYKKYIHLVGAGDYSTTMSISHLGNLAKVDNLLKNIDNLVADRTEKIAKYEAELEGYRKQLQIPFEQAELLKELLLEQAQINRDLNINQNQIVDIDEETA